MALCAVIGSSLVRPWRKIIIFDLLDVPFRFQSYCLCPVHCRLGPFSQFPVHCLQIQIKPSLVRTSLAIGTRFCQVAGIPHQVLQYSLPSSLCQLRTVPESDNFRHTVSYTRQMTVCVQVVSGFASSLYPFYGLCQGGCYFHLCTKPYREHQPQRHIAPSQIIDWCVSLNHVFWWAIQMYKPTHSLSVNHPSVRNNWICCILNQHQVRNIECVFMWTSTNFIGLDESHIFIRQCA